VWVPVRGGEPHVGPKRRGAPHEGGHRHLHHDPVTAQRPRDRVQERLRRALLVELEVEPREDCPRPGREDPKARQLQRVVVVVVVVLTVAAAAAAIVVVPTLGPCCSWW